MKKNFSIALCLLSSYLFSQSFEGTIEFKKKTLTDTVNYVYYVKGDKVRLDEIGSKSKKVEGSFLIDLKTSSMVSLSHDRKLYIEQAPGTPPVVNGKPEVKKTGNTKKVLGQNCTEYVVKNPDEKVQVTYWLANGNYTFFSKLLKILNRKDKSAVYFQQLTGVEGTFPFLSSQVNLATNEEEVKMEVTKVDKKTVDASMFEIPKDYQKFQK
ncbi:MAG: DUF4412 domain-containing protein [Bacteroidetes bacterium]|nr:DUF4412 domain-containing protein [Bacteroidota bacterium]